MLTDTEAVSSTLLVGCTPACAEDDNLVPDRFRLRILESLLLSLDLFSSMLIGDSAVTGGSARPARRCKTVSFKQLHTIISVEGISEGPKMQC